jgi:AAA15 family ATPase/GTPase
MQKIDNIEIKNFKSIRHQKIEGCKRVNVFIGYPNTGKSNILEALSLASDFNNSGKSISLKDLCRFEELIGLYNDGNKQKQIELIINDFVYQLTYIDQLNIEYSVFEIGVILGENSDNDIKFSTNGVINQTGNFGRLANNRQRKQPIIKIKKYQFKDLQNQVRNNPIKLDFPFGSNLSEVLRYNGELRKKCGELFNDYELKLAFDEDVKLKIQKQLDEYSVFQIPMIQVSDTLQRLIFHKAAIASNDDTVQYFITTHSPYVLTEFIEEAQNDLAIYLVGYDKGETIIKRLTDEQVSEVAQYGIDLFFNLESYLDKYGQPHSA